MNAGSCAACFQLPAADPCPAACVCVSLVQVEGGSSDFDADVRSSYLFNSSVVGLDAADAILLVGCNPRLEAPVLNARLRAGELQPLLPPFCLHCPRSQGQSRIKA